MRLSPGDFRAPLSSWGPTSHTEKGQEALAASELQDRALTQGHQALEVSSIRLLKATHLHVPGLRGVFRKVTRA